MIPQEYRDELVLLAKNEVKRTEYIDKLHKLFPKEFRQTGDPFIDVETGQSYIYRSDKKIFE